MAQAQVCPMPMLVANPTAEDWQYFKRLFKNYLEILKAKKDAKLPLLENALGRDGLSILDGLPEPKDSYQLAIARFDDYFSGSCSVLLNRKRFFQARQGIQETIGEYACRLRRLSAECSFSNPPEMLRDVFVMGVYNDRLGERLLTDDADKLTFEAAVSRSQAFERATNDRVKMNGNKSELPSALRVDRLDKGPKCGSKSADKNVFCYDCGSPGEKRGHDECKARDAVCWSCGAKGHFSKRCPSKQSRSSAKSRSKSRNGAAKANRIVNPSSVEPAASQPTQPHVVSHNPDCSDFSAFSVSIQDYVEVSINDTYVKCIPDTGASVNIIPLRMCSASYSTCSRSLRTYGGNLLRVVGIAELNVSYKGSNQKAEFMVVDVNEQYPLLCTRLCNDLGILTEISGKVHSVSTEIGDEFKDLFTGIGVVKNIECDLTVRPDAIPKSSPPRRVPPNLLNRIEQQLTQLQDCGIIKKAENTEWLSPIVPVIKKSGDVRICVDFRYLNQFVVREPYQIPTFEDLISQLSEAKYFSTLDAKSGYHQIVMTENAQKYLGFSTPIGNFQYCRMPFGISSAPEAYQRIMSSILNNCKGTIVYLDDILVYGSSKGEHDSNLRHVLHVLRDSGIKLNQAKCIFNEQKVVFLGHEITSSGVKPSTERINSVISFPEPKSFSDLRSFLGLMEYTGHRFVQNFADICAPMYDLLTHHSFVWNDNAAKAFQHIKDLLLSVDYLKFFDPKKQVCIRTDASQIGLGATLLQDSMPVMFVSRKLKDPETRYSQIEREFLAILFALTRFKSFVFGGPVLLQTDNKPLIAFFNKSIDKLPVRVQKWMLCLQPYTIDIQHISGRENKISDSLSRSPSDGEIYPVESCDETCCFATFSDPLSKDDVRTASLTDPEISSLRESIQKGWKRNSICRNYQAKRFEMSISNDGIVYQGSRIVLPQSLRRRAISQAHSGHVGTDKMKSQLRSLFYWSGMTRDIDNFVKQCDTCVRFSRCNRRSPLTTVADTAKNPWEVLSLDFTGPSDRVQGRVLFTVVDHYSRFPFAFVVKQSSASCIVHCLKYLFAVFGLPKVCVSDNGTAFTSNEFSDFLSMCGITHEFSSVYYPEGNATVERFHGTFKSRLEKVLSEGLDFDSALTQVLYDIRSLPNKSTGVTPFSRLFNREMSTLWQGIGSGNFSTTQTKLSDVYRKRNEHSKFKTLVFSEDQRVLLRRGPKAKFEIPARIIRNEGHGTWLVELINGKQQTYNQKFIKPAPTDSLASDVADDVLNDCSPVGNRSNHSVEHDSVPTSRYSLRPRRRVIYEHMYKF